MASRSKKSLTQDQKTFVTKAYQAASLAGLSGVQADLAVSQAIHESAWGTKPSGVNNYHGIKGKGSKVKTHEIEAGKRKNITASFRNFGDMAGSFRAWAGLMRDKFSGVMSAKTLPEAVKALRAGKPGGYATDPDYNQKVIGTATKLANVGYGPWGAPEQAPGYVADMANAYRTAAYQRAMPSGPTPPATAPVPASRPLDSIGGLGAAYSTAARGRVAPSSPVAPVGERFGYPASPAPAQTRSISAAPSPSRFGAVPMQAQPRSPPMGVVSGPLGPAPIASIPTPTPSSQAAQQIGDFKRALTSDQSQRFRPSAAPAQQATPEQERRGHFVNAVSRSLAPSVPVAPAPAAQKSYYDPAKEYAYAGLTRSLAPAAPVSRAAVPATVPATAAPAPRALTPATVPDARLSRQLGDLADVARREQVSQSQRFRPSALPAVAAPAPAPADMVKATTMQAMPNSPPIGAVNQPLGPANAPPAALAAARNLGMATAAQQINTPAAIPPDVRQTAAYASMPPGTPAALAEKVSQPVQTVQQRPAQTVQTAQQAQQRPAGGIAIQAGPTTTQATAQPQPKGFLGTIGQGIKAAAPVLGSLALGPLGGLLGASIASAKPGQVFGNPFQGLANTAKAMGMFQSGTPYAGPISNYGTGLRAIGDVLGGAAPVGSRAYSRSTPGYHVTSLPNGMVQKTNQYGFTSFERPSMGPTGSSFPGGFSGGFGGFFGGGGQSSGKTSGGRTSGGKSGSGKSGGRKSERSESAGY